MTTTGNIEAIYPLNPVQEGILFHTLYAPESPLYIQQFVCDLRGPLDRDAWVAAWAAVADRHEALRSLLTWEQRERPLQIVRTSAPPAWSDEDWRNLAPDEQRARFEAFLEADRRRGFQLDKAPLQRCGLFRLSDDITRFVWTHHHVIIDGWSMGIVLDEVGRLYGSTGGDGTTVLDPPASYRNYVQWSQSHRRTGAEAFWRAQLAELDAATELRIERAGLRTQWAESHGEHLVALDTEVSARLGDFARRRGVTLSTVLRAAWAILLSRYAGKRDVVFGATVAGRPAELPEALSMVGLLINTLPVRVDVDGDEKVTDLLDRLHRQHLEMVAFETTPLVSVQGWSDVPAGEPLFTSVLVVENVPGPGDVPGLEVADVRYLQRSNYPLAILVMPGERLELIFLFDDERYAADAIERLGEQLAGLLEGLPRFGDQAVGALDILPHAERQRMLVEWNDTEAGYDADRLVDSLIVAASERSPETIAVASGSGSLTYRQLVDRADVLAAALADHEIGPGAIVGIVIGREPACVVAMLGVLRSGAAYVPIDPAFPESRIRFIFEDTSARAIVTTGATDLAAGLPRFVVEADGADAVRPATALSSRTPHTGDDLAYVLYTSGSTGTPKGVMVRQRNLANSTLARGVVYDRPVGTYLVLSPFVFDSSVAGIYWTLAGGGTLLVPPPGLEQDVAALVRMIEDHQVTHTLALPSVWGLLLDFAEPTSLASLEVVIVAGEPCPPSLIERHFAKLASTDLYNEYGPTEATVWATAHRFTPNDAHVRRVSIGRPIPNTAVYVLDEELRPAPMGVPGELAIAGANVAAGYLGRPDLTAERFVNVALGTAGEQLVYRTGDLARWAPDGTLDLLGRIDHQVKLRGQRIELGEIEAVLADHERVAEAAVIKSDTDGRRPFLAAYVQPTAGQAVDEDELVQHAAGRLPRVMVPAVVCVVDSLPRGPTGKVDRAALPDIAASGRRSQEFVPPQGPAEEQLAAIWADVLGAENIGATDNFFELGGDSILSIRIIARAKEAGLRITPRQFFDHPTISGLVAAAASSTRS